MGTTKIERRCKWKKQQLREAAEKLKPSGHDANDLAGALEEGMKLTELKEQVDEALGELGEGPTGL